MEPLLSPIKTLQQSTDILSKELITKRTYGVSSNPKATLQQPPDPLLNWWNNFLSLIQGGITCGAIDEPGKSSKAIDKRVIINLHNKNVVISRFRDKNEAFILLL